MAVVSFDDLTFARNSVNKLGPYPGTIAGVLGAFSTNTPCTVTGTFDGATRTGMQIEGSRTNSTEYSQQHDQWGDLEAVAIDDDTTDTTDPLGTNTSDSITPTTDNQDHYAAQYQTSFDADSEEGTYALSVFGKDNGYDVLLSSIFASVECYSGFDLSAKSVVDESNVIDTDAEDAGSGWCFCWNTRDLTGVGEFIWLRFLVYAMDGTDIYFAGDGTGEVHAWASQCEFGWWPSSIIEVSSTTPVTRPADNAYWAAVDVVSALRGKIDVYVIPQFHSSVLDDSGTTQTILHFDDATQDIKCYIEGDGAGAAQIVVYGASAVVMTGAIAFSRGQLLKITFDPASGEVVVVGATSGNGTHSGSSWSTDDGDVYFGQSSSNADQFFGVIFEPEYEAAATVDKAMLFSRGF